MVVVAEAQAIVDGRHQRFVAVAREEQAVVRAGHGLGEALVEFFILVSGFLIQRISGLEAGLNALDGIQLAQPGLDFVGEVAVMTRQDQDVVFLLLKGEKAVYFLRRGAAVRLHHQQHAMSGQADVVQPRHDLDFLIGVPGPGLQQTGQAVDQGLLDLWGRDLLGIAFDAAGQVLGLFEIQGLALAVQVPGLFAQAGQGGVKLVRFAQWSGQVLDDLGLGQADMGADRARQ